MNQPDLLGAYQRPAAARGVPLAAALLAATGCLLLGLYLGKSSASPLPQPAATVASDDPDRGAIEFDPRAASELAACRAEKDGLLAALEKMGERTPMASPPSSREAATGGSSDSERSTDRGSRSSDDRPRAAEVRPWQGHVEALPNGADIRTYGKVYNGESRTVEGILHVTLVNRSGEAADDASIPMLLSPGLTEWEHIFRWVPEDRYRVTAEWETMVF